MTGQVYAQNKQTYKSVIKAYQLNYVFNHEVVKMNDKKYFRFFPVNFKLCITADFERTPDSVGFFMKTSGEKTPRYFRYGILRFEINGKQFKLTVYQGEQTRETEEYKDYLFVPYTDLTSGIESYGGGKYLEFYLKDIIKNKVVLDFNKSYNPYCAYTTGYNCPIPPRENNLAIPIRAGEMAFGRH